MKQRQPRPLTHLGVLMTDTNSPTEDQMPQEISPRTIPVIMRIDDKNTQINLTSTEHTVRQN